jgi:hypothetical protein
MKEEDKKEKREINKSFIWTILIIIIITIAVIFLLFRRVDYVNETDAKFIGNHSILYVQLGCSHCQKQENIFGENVKYINIVDCYYNPFDCLNITAVPTWKINGEYYVGYKSLEDLKKIFINQGIQEDK